MPKVNIEFAFSIGDKVLIHEIQRPGIVMALRQDNFALMYLITYWNDGTRKEEWLYEWELEARGQPK